MEQPRSRPRRARLAIAVATVVVVAALAAFEPWRAFTSSTVDETAPVSADVVRVSGEESRLAPQDPTPTTAAEASTEEEEEATEEEEEATKKERGKKGPAAQPTEPTPTTTTAPTPTAPEAEPATEAPSPAPTATPAPDTQDAELARGRFEDAEHSTTGLARVLQLADGSRVLRLEDLATSDGPDLHVWISNQPSGGEWGSYDDDRYVRLGELKATNGNQNYAIPASADLRGMTTVVIWCDRFNVAFGTAPVDL